MSNKITEVVKFGGREFALKDPTGNDWIELEGLIGRPISKLGSVDGLSMKDIRAILYMVLKASNNGEAIDLLWVGDNYNFKMFDVLQVIINFLMPKENPKPEVK